VADDTDREFDSEALAAELERFGGTDAERRVVARQARDLADSGQLAADRGTPLTVATVVEELADAPRGGPADRWNWWLGALTLAYGGYEQFGVRRVPDEGEPE
jgi:hypothetical protein